MPATTVHQLASTSAQSWLRPYYIWFDGELLLVEDTPSHFVADATQPTTGQETIRCYATSRGPAIFRLDEYLERFLYTLRAMGIPDIGYDRARLQTAVCQTVQANGFVAGYVRPFVVYRPQADAPWPQQYQPTIAIAAWRGAGDYRPEMPVTIHAEGVAMTITAPDEMVFKREQMILVHDETLYVAPGVTSLHGLMRDAVLTLAQDAGYTILGSPLTSKSLALADEMMLCNTTAAVTGVVAVNGNNIGDGRSGPVTRQLQTLFQETVNGRHPHSRRWLEYVDRAPHI